MNSEVDIAFENAIAPWREVVIAAVDLVREMRHPVHGKGADTQFLILEEAVNKFLEDEQ